jgi:hypothetical protein
LASCQNSAPRQNSAPVPGAGLSAAVDQRNAAIDPRLVPLFSALDDALAADNRPLARRLMQQIEAQTLTSGERDAVERVALVLDGRDLQESLTLEVRSRPLSEPANHREAYLVVSHGLELPLTLDLPPALVLRSHRAISPEGQEFVDAGQTLSDSLLRLDVPAGAPAELVLCHYPARFDGALAVQERLSLSTRDGVAVVGERQLPLHDLKVRSSQRTLLFGELPSQPLDEKPLLELVARPGLLEKPAANFLPGLLERTVRIAPSRQKAALLDLSRFAQGLSDEQLLKLTPALRWLGGVEYEVPSPAHWRAMLVEFAATGEALDQRPTLPEPEPGLVLPGVKPAG